MNVPWQHKLPMGADSDFGCSTLVKARVEIFAGTPNAALDASNVIAQIKARGFAFHSYRRAQFLETEADAPQTVA